MNVRRRLGTAGLVALCWVAGGGVVRVGLDAVDRTPYSPTSEIWYLVVAAVAVAVAVGGTAAVVRKRRLR
ncbi:hypothetical protein [Rhodococcus sp. Q]|uniref:hypothetical protein n=1 Tax=Rhodococcus sp. Q TaxID=2502252 RepID=UPI0010F9177E|nr:hypothetical protein [Rhodococcus sp. Q]